MIIGLALEVAVALVAFVITHENISKKREKTLKHWLEACAVLAGILVLLAIIGEHKVGKLDTQEIDQLEKARKSATNDLAKLEARVREKSFGERLRAFLNALDKQILPALSNGTNRVHGFFTQYQLGELQKFANESEAAKYLKIEYGDRTTVGQQGLTTEATLILSINLIKAP